MAGGTVNAAEGTLVSVQTAMSHLPPGAAKMAAVEVLLADPDALQDDVLESCLYILREKLRATL